MAWLRWLADSCRKPLQQPNGHSLCTCKLHATACYYYRHTISMLPAASATQGLHSSMVVEPTLPRPHSAQRRHPP
jgi:hypothetical protein